jgi:nitrogen fixation NifU-like protein
MDLKTLYREVIIDHYKKPRNSRPLQAPSHEARCKNPSCGDRITLQLRVADDSIVEVAMLGTGCAISQASASMMTQAIKGRTLAEADAVLAAFRGMIVDADENPDQDVLGDLVSMQGVAKLHARVKCAMCGWSALEAALAEDATEVDLDQDTTMPAAKRGGGY